MWTRTGATSCAWAIREADAQALIGATKPDERRDEIKSRPAIIEEPVGEFRMLYNAIFSYRQLGEGLSTAPAPSESAGGEAGAEPPA